MKTSILIGSRQDPQCQTLRSFADITCWWEDWGTLWSISALDGKITLHRYQGEGHVCRSFAGDQTHVYLRYGGCPREAEDQYVVLAALHPEMVGVARPESAPLNKLNQLALFGPMAPRTYVTNHLKCLDRHPQTLVVKNISTLRSVAASCDQTHTDLTNSKLSIPTLFQEKLAGQEYKHHHYASGYSHWSFTVHILKTQEVLDYRYGDQGFLTKPEVSPPQAIADLGAQLCANPKAPLIDLDYMVEPNGKVWVLEWNDSPESASFEGRCRLRQNWSFSRLLLAPLQMVTISPQNDRVVQVLAENNPHETSHGSSLVGLTCEAFTKDWHFGLMDQSLVFYLGAKPIVPTGIYIRPVNVPDSLIQDYDSLFRAVELWPGPTFGSMSYGFYNSSKMFQTQKSLLQARKLSQTDKLIGFPKSYFIKGQTPQVQQLLGSRAPMIVKSCSGARSIVVDQDTYQKWDSKHLHSIPTLFQEAVMGPDIRVHGLLDQLFAIKVSTKDSIDYRYAGDRGGFETWDVPGPVRAYVETLAYLEGNPLIGVDLIEKDGKYFCLEANPTPGWTWYYNQNTCSVNHLALGILKLMSPP